MKPLVTIAMINHRTPELTKFCLRTLKRHTDLGKVKIVVVDNDSQDESLEYLRSLKNITLIERTNITEIPTVMHANALDMALEHADTPYFLSIHTDSIVLTDDWLDFLISEIEKSPDIAGVGS